MYVVVEEAMYVVVWILRSQSYGALLTPASIVAGQAKHRTVITTKKQFLCVYVPKVCVACYRKYKMVEIYLAKHYPMPLFHQERFSEELSSCGQVKLIVHDNLEEI